MVAEPGHRGVSPSIWAAAFLALHALCIAVFPAQATALSSLFLTLAPGFATAAVVWRYRSSDRRMRRHWAMVGCGLLLWTLASIMAAREQLLLQIPGNVGAGSQILYFLYGAPLLLAICSPAENVWDGPFMWLDSLQVALLAFLIYVTIFRVVPFSHQPLRPISGELVVLTFNVENLVLVIVASLRLIATPPDREQRRAHSTLCLFLWLYAGMAALYNHLTLSTPGAMGLSDIVVDVPFLYFACAALAAKSDERFRFRFPHSKTFALILDNASPVLFPAAILAMSVSAARTHLRTGIVCTAAALLIYGARSSLLQIRFQRSQAEAKKARDHMELLSLTDPLTGVPNRRRFNDLLASEWSRMSRQRGPLSLLLIDIDYFKLLNDTFGHSDGDICLRQVAHALQASLRRESDSLCRYGGEEFAALLPGTDRAGAEIVALRMQATIRSLRLRTRTPLGTNVTVSIGLNTSYEGAGATHDALIRAADRALYRAKANGRDRIEHEVVESFDGGPVKEEAGRQDAPGLSMQTETVVVPG